MEIIALCCVMAILYFSICAPMRWLADNTHYIGNLDYDWSVRSMGKAIDALHDAMVQIKADGSKFLNKDFINHIFLKYTMVVLWSLLLKPHSTPLVSVWFVVYHLCFTFASTILLINLVLSQIL
jgi:hypothetical protein